MSDGLEKYKKIQTDWQNSHEWQLVVENIVRFHANGMSSLQISRLTEVPEEEVVRICNQEDVALEVSKRTYETRIPLLKEIIGLSLYAARSRLKEMLNPENLRKTIKKPFDLKNLLVSIEKLNGMLRLEEGKATAHQAIVQTSVTNYQNTQDLLRELDGKDPIFDDRKLLSAEIIDAE